MNNIISGKNNYNSPLSSIDDVKRNLNEVAIPEMLIDATSVDYEEFMRQRRLLMAEKIREYYKLI